MPCKGSHSLWAGPPQGTSGLEPLLLQLKPLILMYFFLYFH